jgi:hypothetical protein
VEKLHGKRLLRVIIACNFSNNFAREAINNIHRRVFDQCDSMIACNIGAMQGIFSG